MIFLGSNLLFWRPFRFKNRSEIDLGRHVALKHEKTSHLCPKGLPRRPPGRSRGRSKIDEKSLRDPLGSPWPRRTSQGPLRDRFLIDFGPPRHRFLIDFWTPSGLISFCFSGFISLWEHLYTGIQHQNGHKQKWLSFPLPGEDSAVPHAGRVLIPRHLHVFNFRFSTNRNIKTDNNKKCHSFPLQGEDSAVADAGWFSDFFSELEHLYKGIQ